jgi:hypothetical protein
MDQLSSLVVHYLSQALGTLFEGDFSEKNLSLEIASGSFSLENVQLKEQFFSDLPVSLILSHGSIGRLDLTIPWKNLGSAPLRVSLDNVNILLRPCFVKDTKSSAARKAHQMKLAKLSSVDSLCKLRTKSASHSSTPASFLFHYLKEKVASMIFRTLEVSVCNVHLRFEDQVSCREALGGFCLGVTLESALLRPSCHTEGMDTEEVDAEEVDAEEERGGVLRVSRGATRRLFRSTRTLQQQCDISSLAVYCNSLSMVSRNMCCVPFVGKSSKEIEHAMSATISRRWSSLPPAHAYLLRPQHLALQLGAAFSNNSRGDVHIGVEVLAGDVTCELGDAQLRNMASFVHFTGMFLAANQFSDHRPDPAAGAEVGGRRRLGDPAAWWRFAIRAVRRQLGHFSRLRLSAESVDKYFQDKLVYTGEGGREGQSAS